MCYAHVQHENTPSHTQIYAHTHSHTQTRTYRRTPCKHFKQSSTTGKQQTSKIFAQISRLRGTALCRLVLLFCEKNYRTRYLCSSSFDNDDDDDDDAAALICLFLIQSLQRKHEAVVERLQQEIDKIQREGEFAIMQLRTSRLVHIMCTLIFWLCVCVCVCVCVCETLAAEADKERAIEETRRAVTVRKSGYFIFKNSCGCVFFFLINTGFFFSGWDELWEEGSTRQAWGEICIKLFLAHQIALVKIFFLFCFSIFLFLKK